MIRLFWAKCNNFGDELSPYIINKLSGEKVIYRRNFSYDKFIPDVLRFVKSLFIRRKIEVDCLKYSFTKKVIISVGSVINESTDQCLVWGSGIISKDTIIKGGTFSAVRGEKTRERLKDLGFKVPVAVGDPALLLPLLYPVKYKSSQKNIIGIIPHIFDFNEINKKFSIFEHLKIIDLRSSNVENIIDQITDCDLIVSTSLHGVIVAHSYNIPALHFVLNELNGDGVKFEDYYSSVDIPNYKSFNLYDINLSSIELIRSFFNKNKVHSLPDLKLLKRNQINLIKVAPFFVKKRYLKFDE